MQKSTKDDEAEEGSLKQESLASDSDSPSICLETNSEKGSPVRELGDEPSPGAVDPQAANRRTAWKTTYFGRPRRATTENEDRRPSASYQDFISGETKSFRKYKSTVE